MKVYHYTKGIHLEKIIESGVINTEPSSYGEDDILNNKKDPQLHVWLTTEEYVPNTARPVYRPTRLDIDQYITRYILETSEFDAFYRFIFDTSDKRIIPWSVRQKKVRGSKTKAYLKSQAKYSGDDISKWWVSSEALEIGEYERAELQPNAKDFVVQGGEGSKQWKYGPMGPAVR